MNPTGVNSAGKVNLNPFYHCFTGVKNLFSTNALPAVLASIVLAVASFIINLLYSFFVLDSIKNFNHKSISSSEILALTVKVIAFWLITTLLTGFFIELVTRTIITGSRRERVSFGSLFPFVGKRYLTAVLSFLMAGAVYLLGILLVIGAGLIYPLLALPVGFIVGIFLIIFSLHMCYLFFVVVDDEKPNSAFWSIKQSAALWGKSRGALTLYSLVSWVAYLGLVLIFTVVILVTHLTTTAASPAIAGHANSTANLLVTIVVTLLGSAFALAVSAGVGDIYNNARLALSGGFQPPMPGPYNPMPTQPMSPQGNQYQPPMPPTLPVNPSTYPPSSMPIQTLTPSYQQPTQQAPAMQPASVFSQPPVPNPAYPSGSSSPITNTPTQQPVVQPGGPALMPNGTQYMQPTNPAQPQPQPQPVSITVTPGLPVSPQSDPTSNNITAQQ